MGRMLKKGFCCKALVVLGVLLYVPHMCRAEIRITSQPLPNTLTLVSVTDTAQILIDRSDAKVVEIAAGLLADDIEGVTGKKPKITYSPGELSSNTVIIAGTLGKSSLVDSLIASGKVDVSAIEGKWEACIVATVDNISPSIKRAVVVVGSDRRGTAYGLMDISRAIGVSPWVWWADVKPEQKPSLYMAEGVHIETGPSIKFRGIFINDEGWSLMPWIQNTFDPELGNIGPKTYTKIFDLMLRLKANYLWPAMHECSHPFNQYPENARIAADYAIVAGSSHCEPMLRNNFTEWYPWQPPEGEEKGPWNYFTNPDQIYQYWDERLQTNGNYENVYTVGMRGIQDGSMLGGRSNEERARKLEEVFADQREILTKRTGLNIEDVPQIFCPYKEVMYVYDAGLKVPDDVTICWAEDNQGYMRRLPNENERKRSGGHGLYYHLSYWSDYLWLSTFSPQLLSYELTKAADYKVDRLWVFNVGDIKICEKEIDFAMDLAWDLKAWGPAKADQWTKHWAGRTFGNQHEEEIALVLNEYYRLAFRGKPEHIGHVSYSLAEIKQRLSDYSKISKKCEQLRKSIPERLQDAFTHLVYYPVVACKFHNEKILKARLSFLYAERGDREKSFEMSKHARNAWEMVKTLTEQYNSTANGKWQHLMSWHPRNLKVFYMPPVATEQDFKNKQEIKLDIESATVKLPMVRSNGILFGNSPKTESRKTGGKAAFEFEVPKSGSYYIYVEAQTPSANEDSFFFVFNDKEELIMNRQVTGDDWRWLNAGKVNLAKGTQKLVVSQREPNAKMRRIIISSEEKRFSSFPVEPVKILTMNEVAKSGDGDAGRTLVFDRGLSIDGLAAYSYPHLAAPISEDKIDSAPFIEFKVKLPKGKRRIRVKCLPSHPVTKKNGLRYAFSINGEKAVIRNVKYKETFHNHNSCLRTLTICREPDLMGYVSKVHEIELPEEQEVTIRISILDPALVVHRVECF